MLRLICLFSLLLLFTGFCIAQETRPFSRPDFDSIHSLIKDKSSAYYYPTLFNRYKNNDTTLSEKEFSLLYYGYSFQDNYSPYGRSDANDKLEKLFEKEHLSDKDNNEIIKLENKVLEEYPFNLRNINRLITALNDNGDTAAASIQMKKLIGIAKAIFSTGDGRTDTTAMYVISVEHEYDLVYLLGIGQSAGQALLNTAYGQVDKLEITGGAEFKEIYFNVSRLFASMENMFKKK